MSGRALAPAMTRRPSPQCTSPSCSGFLAARLPTRRCVTPYVLVPGKWSAADLEYVADSVAAGLTNNAGGLPGLHAAQRWAAEVGYECWSVGHAACACAACPACLLPTSHACQPCPCPAWPDPPPGHNCLKAELLVTDRSWPQREAFLDALRAKLASLPNRVAYYPGRCMVARCACKPLASGCIAMRCMGLLQRLCPAVQAAPTAPAPYRLGCQALGLPVAFWRCGAAGPRRHSGRRGAAGFQQRAGRDARHALAAQGGAHAAAGGHAGRKLVWRAAGELGKAVVLAADRLHPGWLVMGLLCALQASGCCLSLLHC